MGKSGSISSLNHSFQVAVAAVAITTVATAATAAGFDFAAVAKASEEYFD